MPLATGRPSIVVTGRTSEEVLVRNASRASQRLLDGERPLDHLDAVRPRQLQHHRAGDAAQDLRARADA